MGEDETQSLAEGSALEEERTGGKEKREGEDGSYEVEEREETREKWN